jgi:hypothetical protein
MIKVSRLAAAAALLALIAACSAPTDGEVDAANPEEAVTSESALSGSCTLWSGLAAAGVQVTARALAATGVCAAGALAVSAGTLEPVCLVPAGGAAVSAILTALATKAAKLECATTTEHVIPLAEAEAKCPPSSWFTPSHGAEFPVDCTDTVGCLKSSFHYPCAGAHTNGTKTYQYWSADKKKCVTTTKKAVRCEGPTVRTTCAGNPAFIRSCGKIGPHVSGVWDAN